MATTNTKIEWCDGELMPRPFAPGWRRQSIKSARDKWQRAVTPAEAKRLLRESLGRCA